MFTSTMLTSTMLTSYGKEEAMNQASENDKKAPKDRDDHHDDANPMPDTHHVNPNSDDSPTKKTDNDKK